MLSIGIFIEKNFFHFSETKPRRKRPEQHPKPSQTEKHTTTATSSTMETAMETVGDSGDDDGQPRSDDEISELTEIIEKSTTTTRTTKTEKRSKPRQEEPAEPVGTQSQIAPETPSKKTKPSSTGQIAASAVESTQTVESVAKSPGKSPERSPTTKTASPNQPTVESVAKSPGKSPEKSPTTKTASPNQPTVATHYSDHEEESEMTEIIETKSVTKKVTPRRPESARDAEETFWDDHPTTESKPSSKKAVKRSEDIEKATLLQPDEFEEEEVSEIVEVTTTTTVRSVSGRGQEPVVTRSVTTQKGSVHEVNPLGAEDGDKGAIGKKQLRKPSVPADNPWDEEESSEMTENVTKTTHTVTKKVVEQKLPSETAQEAAPTPEKATEAKPRRQRPASGGTSPKNLPDDVVNEAGAGAEEEEEEVETVTTTRTRTVIKTVEGQEPVVTQTVTTTQRGGEVEPVENTAMEQSPIVEAESDEEEEEPGYVEEIIETVTTTRTVTKKSEELQPVVSKVTSTSQSGDMKEMSDTEEFERLPVVKKSVRPSEPAESRKPAQSPTEKTDTNRGL